MFLSLKTLYRKRTVIWPFYFYTIIRTLSNLVLINVKDHQLFCHIILRGLPYEVAFYLSPNIALRLIIHI